MRYRNKRHRANKHAAPTDPEQARRQRCADAAWRFLVDAVAEQFPSDGVREAAATALRRDRAFKTITGTAPSTAAVEFRVPLDTVRRMPRTLADLLAIGGELGPDGKTIPISTTYSQFRTWRQAKAGAEREHRDYTQSAWFSGANRKRREAERAEPWGPPLPEWIAAKKRR